MEYLVIKYEDDWAVSAKGGDIITHGLSNSQAWREVDRLNNEPMNKSQDRSDYHAKQTLNVYPFS